MLRPLGGPRLVGMWEGREQTDSFRGQSARKRKRRCKDAAQPGADPLGGGKPAGLGGTDVGRGFGPFCSPAPWQPLPDLPMPLESLSQQIAPGTPSGSAVWPQPPLYSPSLPACILSRVEKPWERLGRSHPHTLMWHRMLACPSDGSPLCKCSLRDPLLPPTERTCESPTSRADNLQSNNSLLCLSLILCL